MKKFLLLAGLCVAVLLSPNLFRSIDTIEGASAQFIFVRHGDTDWDIRRLKEFPINEPLNSNGKKQIQKLSIRIVDYIPRNHFPAVISSPLLRAKETAEIIAKDLGIGIILFNKKLQERHYGTFELNKDSKNILQKNAETDEEFNKRTSEVFQYLENVASQDSRFPIIVSHKGVFKSFLRITNNEITELSQGQMALFFKKKGKWHFKMLKLKE